MSELIFRANYALNGLKLLDCATIKEITLNPGEKFSLRYLVRKNILSHPDALRAHILLTKGRPWVHFETRGRPETLPRPDEDIFTHQGFIFSYTICDTTKGPELTIIEIHDGNKIQFHMAPQTPFLDRCSVCFIDIKEAPSPQCPCMLTRYCSQKCQKSDWDLFGHKKVHEAFV